MQSVTQDAMARQADDIDTLPAEWEALADAGRTLAEANDVNRWLLGDLARKVDRVYGDKSLEQYASDIQVFYKTLLTYRTTSSFYPPSIRSEFPALSWSHYRMCVRLGDLNAALRMLSDASDGNWSARDLTDALNVALGRPPVRRPILETEVTADDAGLHVDDALLVPGVTYAIKVYSHE